MRVYAITINAKNRETSLYDFGEALEMAMYMSEPVFKCKFMSICYELKSKVKIWHAHGVLVSDNTISAKKLSTHMGLHLNLKPIKQGDHLGFYRWLNYITKEPQAIPNLEALDMERRASYQFLFNIPNIDPPLLRA